MGRHRTMAGQGRSVSTGPPGISLLALGTPEKCPHSKCNARAKLCQRSDVYLGNIPHASCACGFPSGEIISWSIIVVVLTIYLLVLLCFHHYFAFLSYLVRVFFFWILRPESSSPGFSILLIVWWVITVANTKKYNPLQWIIK